MSRSALLTLVVAAAVGAGCGGPTASDRPVSRPTATSAIERAQLPAGFPILPGASPSPLADDDEGLIAAWSSDRLGSAAYNFYLDALPRAGYPIVGAYPGGEVALIRFRAAGGAIWQTVVRARPSAGLTIEIRLDRP